MSTPTVPCAVCLRTDCTDWCDGYPEVLCPDRRDHQKVWECAAAWMQDAAWDLEILYINRQHRSGPCGEAMVAEAARWLSRCERDEQIARYILGCANRIAERE